MVLHNLICIYQCILLPSYQKLLAYRLGSEARMRIRIQTLLHSLVSNTIRIRKQDGRHRVIYKKIKEVERL